MHHVLDQHRKKQGICPICICYEHADPSYVSPNLGGHLELRHATDEVEAKLGKRKDPSISEVSKALTNDITSLSK